MNKTKIEWCTHTWNPVTGCQHMCEYCYARKIAIRFNGHFKPTFHEKVFNKSLKTRQQANIFVGSMTDLFGKWVPKIWIKKVLSKCNTYPNQRFLFLTKDPRRLKDFRFYNNCWVGFSASSSIQYMYNYDYVHHHNFFVSLEPIQAGVVLNMNAYRPKWVIVGAETGNRKGKIKPEKEWIEALIDECKEHKIPLFLKDNLNWPKVIKQFPWEEE